MIEGKKEHGWLQELCKVLVKAPMILPVKWVLQSLDTVEGKPQVANTFSNSFFATVGGQSCGKGRRLHRSRKNKEYIGDPY